MSATKRSRSFGHHMLAIAAVIAFAQALACAVPTSAAAAADVRDPPPGASRAEQRSYAWKAKARVAGSADRKEVWVTGRGTVRAASAAKARAAAASAMTEQASRWGRVLEVVVSSVE